MSQRSRALVSLGKRPTDELSTGVVHVSLGCLWRACFGRFNFGLFRLSMHKFRIFCVSSLATEERYHCCPAIGYSRGRSHLVTSEKMDCLPSWLVNLPPPQRTHPEIRPYQELLTVGFPYVRGGRLTSHESMAVTGTVGIASHVPKFWGPKLDVETLLDRRFSVGVGGREFVWIRRLLQHTTSISQICILLEYKANDKDVLCLVYILWLPLCSLDFCW